MKQQRLSHFDPDDGDDTIPTANTLKRPSSGGEKKRKWCFFVLLVVQKGRQEGSRCKLKFHTLLSSGWIRSVDIIQEE
jgi:hypothetical protein